MTRRAYVDLVRRSGAHTSLAMSTWPGWIKVLPSKPNSAPCSALAPEPVGVLHVVVDAVEDHLARLACGQHRRREVGHERRRDRRPVSHAAPWRGRWCPSRATPTRGGRRSRARRGSRSASRSSPRSRISAGAPAASSSAETVVEVRGRVDLRDRRPRQRRTRRRGADVVDAPRRVEAVAADRELASAVLARPPPRRTPAARAAGLASGATASSRSKISASAGIVLAFSSARSLAAGMYSTDRRGRSVAHRHVNP